MEHVPTRPNFMTHIAITEGDTEWGDHLTDTEYPGPDEQRTR